MPHHGVLSLMSWCGRMLGEATHHRYTAIDPLHFDNSVFDTYCGLVAGGTLVPVETGELLTPPSWAAAIRAVGAANRARVERDFSKQVMVDKYRRIYGSALQSGLR